MYENIWLTICSIPRGKVLGYGHVAELAGAKGNARLVGKVIGMAPAHMQLPWHRVVRSSGEIAFPAESTQAITQAELLFKEGILTKNNRVAMKQFKWQPSLEDLFSLGLIEQQ